ncbi:MAG: CoA-binding protein [Betaproteobacteria bacterium]
MDQSDWPRCLENFLRPRSVAVVGAGDRATSSGGAVLRNLELCRWPGRVIPVNPKGGTIRGIPVAVSLRDVQPPADLVVIVVRPDNVLAVIEEAATTGHSNLLVLPGGFSEAGEVGAERDRQLRALAKQHNMLIGGPNCAGLISLLDPEWPFAATFFRDMPRGGGVALLSQSGAIVEEMISASHEMRLPLGAVVSIGNAMQLDMASYLEALGNDPACKAVLLYAESFGQGERFLEVARGVSARKPIIALVGGRSAEGRSAAFRHTGSAARESADVDAFCLSCGILRVGSLRELKLAAKAFAFFPSGLGHRVLILSNSGGPGVLATDRCVAEGLELIDLPEDAVERLMEALPPEAAVANPMDLLADARADRFVAALEILRHSPIPQLDAILLIHVVPFMVDAGPVVAALAGLAGKFPIPLFHCMMGTLTDREPWLDELERAGVPVFGDSEEMCMAASMLARHRKLLGRTA